MGTRLDIVLPFIAPDKGKTIFEKIRTEINRIELQLSYFNPASKLSEINKNAFTNPVKADDELFDIIKKCVRFYHLTNGYFDITMRPLMNLWMQEGSISATKLRELKTHSGMNNLILDEGEQTVRFKNKHIAIDLGGYGKGYALDILIKILSKNAITSALLSFGNSSIAVIGKHPHGDYWGIGIEDVYNHRNLYTFKASDASVSTSGITAANLKKHRGLPHIINPQTLKPAAVNKTIAVLSEIGTVAEVASTALMVCKTNEINSILMKLEIKDGIEINYSENKTATVSKLKYT